MIKDIISIFIVLSLIVAIFDVCVLTMHGIKKLVFYKQSFKYLIKHLEPEPDWKFTRYQECLPKIISDKNKIKFFNPTDKEFCIEFWKENGKIKARIPWIDETDIQNLAIYKKDDKVIVYGMTSQGRWLRCYCGEYFIWHRDYSSQCQCIHTFGANLKNENTKILCYEDVNVVFRNKKIELYQYGIRIAEQKFEEEIKDVEKGMIYTMNGELYYMYIFLIGPVEIKLQKIDEKVEKIQCFFEFSACSTLVPIYRKEKRFYCTLPNNAEVFETFANTAVLEEQIKYKDLNVEISTRTIELTKESFEKCHFEEKADGLYEVTYRVCGFEELFYSIYVENQKELFELLLNAVSPLQFCD